MVEEAGCPQPAHHKANTLDKQPFTHTFTPKVNLESVIQLSQGEHADSTPGLSARCSSLPV